LSASLTIVPARRGESQAVKAQTNARNASGRAFAGRGRLSESSAARADAMVQRE